MKRLSTISLLLIMTACGVQDSSDLKDGIADSDHRIFVTSASFTGSLNGLSGADQKCQDAKSSAGLERNYKAIVSVTGSEAKSRLNITGSIFMFTDDSTRELIAANGVDLWDTGNEDLINSVNRSEGYLTISDTVWTGTNNDGSLAFETCNNWTSISSDGQYGNSENIRGEWVESGFESCANANHLYCISVSN